MNQYRFVLFTPDPVSEVRLPLGVLVRYQGQVLAVPASAPAAGRLPSGQQMALHRMLVEDLYRVDTFEHLPRWMGPHVVLAPPRPLPDGINDPPAWVQDHLLGTAVTSNSTSARRAALGNRLFQTYGVEGLVRRHFLPEQDWDRRLSGAGLGRISHWAASPTRLLLLEPLAPDLGLRQQEQEVFDLFSRYRAFLRREEGTLRAQVKLLVYGLPGLRPRDVNRLRTALVDADDFIDTGAAAERARLIAQIRSGSDPG